MKKHEGIRKQSADSHTGASFVSASARLMICRLHEGSLCESRCPLKLGMVVKCILVAALAVVSLCGKADIPTPTYRYHALSRLDFYAESLNEISEKVGLTGNALIDLMLFGVLLVFVACLFTFLRKLKFGLVDVIVFCLHIAAAVAGLAWVFRTEIKARFVGEDSAKGISRSLKYGDVVDVPVSPKKGETYKEYLKRVYRIEHNLCPNCDRPMHQIYDMGRRWVCDECNVPGGLNAQ